MNYLTRVIRYYWNRLFHKEELELKVRELHYGSTDEGTMLSIMAEHPIVQQLAGEFSQMFRDIEKQGLPANFLDIRVLDPATLETFLVRISRSTRPDAGEQIRTLKQLLKSAEAEIDPLKEKLGRAQADADQLAAALDWARHPYFDEYDDPYYEDHPTSVVGDRKANAGMVRAARKALALHEARKARAK